MKFPNSICATSGEGSLEGAWMKHGIMSPKTTAPRSRCTDEGDPGEGDLPNSTFELKEPAAGTAEGGITEKDKDAADVTMAAAAAEADTDGEGGGVRLSQAYVDYVLSWKPEVYDDPDELYARRIKNPAFTLDEVEWRTQLQRELVEQSKECAASVESFHAWVCAEYREKGYVEVDDDYIAEGIELRKALEEDELYALAFGPMEGVIAEDEDDGAALSA